MRSDATTVDEYLSELGDDRRGALSAVRQVILDNLPDGYEEIMQYGMISYVVPLDVLADTYNGQPLMYIALASQRQYMSLYLTNVYGDESVEKWFKERYLATGKKLNMGKSCVRFRKLDDPLPRTRRRSRRRHPHRRIRQHLPSLPLRPPLRGDSTQPQFLTAALCSSADSITGNL